MGLNLAFKGLSQILHFLLSLVFGLNLNALDISSRLPWALSRVPLLITSLQRNFKITEFIENMLQV